MFFVFIYGLYKFNDYVIFNLCPNSVVFFLGKFLHSCTMRVDIVTDNICVPTH